MRPHINMVSKRLEALLRPDVQIDESETSGGKMCFIRGSQPYWNHLWNGKKKKKNPGAWIPTLGSLI